MGKASGCYTKDLRTENWTGLENEVQALSSKQVDWLMKGFAISPKIKNTKAREFY